MKKVISAYTDAWVIFRYGDTCVSDIFLSKKYAKKAAEKQEKENYDYHRNIHKNMTDDQFKKYMEDNKYLFKKYEIKSLDDAIYCIKEFVTDNARLQERVYQNV